MNILSALLLLISIVTVNMCHHMNSINLHTLLHFDKPKSKSDLSDEERKAMLLGHIQTLVSNPCNFHKEDRPKECNCFECFNNDNASQDALANHLFQWAALDKEKRDSIIINEIPIPVKLEEELERLGVKKKVANP